MIGRETHDSWGEVAPGQWGTYLSRRETVRPGFVTACAMQWQQLREENAPLRMVLNGRLQSGPEDLYDSFLLRELAIPGWPAASKR